MEVGMCLNPLIRLPISSCSRTHEDSLSSTRNQRSRKQRLLQHQQKRVLLVVQAKRKRGGMAARQFQRQLPPLPKIEDDGNPRFVIYIRMANVCLWYPIEIVTGGTTEKLMVAAKDNVLGKYIYKDTLARNLAAAIYRDEKEMQKMAMKQHHILRSAREFRYGYKIVENNNLRAALTNSDVIELPTQDELKTVLDKVNDFFGNAKEAFGKITSLSSPSELSEQNSDENSKERSLR